MVEVNVVNVSMEGKSVITMFEESQDVKRKENVEPTSSFSITSSLFSSLSSSSLTDGALLISLPSSHSLTLSQVMLRECVCPDWTRKNSQALWGRGGGMHLSVGDSSPTLSLSSVLFFGNRASLGRDVYAVSVDLVSVIPTSFVVMEGIEGVARERSFWGKDEGNMKEESDVFFFREYVGERIGV
jgi:hypothetical protein